MSEKWELSIEVEMGDPTVTMICKKTRRDTTTWVESYQEVQLSLASLSTEIKEALAISETQGE